MTLERRISEALHQIDTYEPSVDLYARTTRSIDEDRIRRKRIISGVAWILAALLGVVAFFMSVVERTDTGFLVVPRWTVLAVQIFVSVIVVMVLAPLIRRYGGPFIEAAFHMSPETGIWFARLLDIAYYLLFGGVVVLGLSFSGLEATVVLPHEAMEPLAELARLLTLMGVAHAFNLLAIPVVGLIFGSVTRRALRRAAGELAPAESPRAKQADRVATWIVYGVAALILANLLVLTGLVVGVGMFG